MNENITSGNDTDYEKISYGRITYKRVQKLRRKGKKRGIEVPYLGYELNKPEKPRIAFWIVAIISALLFVATLVLIGFLVDAIIKLYADLDNTGLGDLLANLFNPDYVVGSLGISATLGIMAVVLAYGLVLVFVSLFVSLAMYFYRFVRDAVYMAKCSKEEFAKGSIISSRIFSLTTVLGVATVILIAALIQIPSTADANLYLGLVYGGLLLTVGGLLALMIVERRKNAKWFESLEEDKKQNFLAHNDALKRVKRRLRFERSFWDDFGR